MATVFGWRVQPKGPGPPVPSMTVPRIPRVPSGAPKPRPGRLLRASRAVEWPRLWCEHWSIARAPLPREHTPVAHEAVLSWLQQAFNRIFLLHMPTVHLLHPMGVTWGVCPEGTVVQVCCLKAGVKWPPLSIIPQPYGGFTEVPLCGTLTSRGCLHTPVSRLLPRWAAVPPAYTESSVAPNPILKPMIF